MDMRKIKLKDDQGRIIEVKKKDCCKQNKDGYRYVNLHLYTYFYGKETEEMPNLNNDELEELMANG